MAESKASTAHVMALVAALEQSRPRPRRILQDPLAPRMLPPALRLLVGSCRLGPVRRAVLALLERLSPGLQCAIVCRKRYIEDTVRGVLGSEPEALVVLGAGLDSLAYRM